MKPSARAKATQDKDLTASLPSRQQMDWCKNASLDASLSLRHCSCAPVRRAAREAASSLGASAFCEGGSRFGNQLAS
eukprot:756440-Hanusia_phi.AAC.1